MVVVIITVLSEGREIAFSIIRRTVWWSRAREMELRMLEVRRDVYPMVMRRVSVPEGVERIFERRETVASVLER